MRRIEVVRENALKEGVSTPGIRRDRAFESTDVTVSRSRVAGGVVSGWHHHGAKHLYGFLVSGLLRLDYGPKGGESVELRPGDFFHIPPGLVHRDVNDGGAEELIVVNVLVGKGIPNVNVPGPDH